MDELLTPTIEKLASMGVCFSMFVIITTILCSVIKTLYTRNQELGSAFLTAITDHTTAMNNLAGKIENIGGAADVRKSQG